MTILLCPDCLRWQDAERSCAACGRMLDLFATDPPRDILSHKIGDWRECLGEADVVRSMWPSLGWLHVTSLGLLFVPRDSVVVNPKLIDIRPQPAVGMLGRWCHRLFGSTSGDKLSGIESLPSPRELESLSSCQIAEVLLSDPGVFFLSRQQIVSWRWRWRSLEFLRPDARWWPERLVPRERDVQNRLLNWLETTACPSSTKTL